LKLLGAILDIGIAESQRGRLERRVGQEQRRACPGVAACGTQAEIRHSQELGLEVDLEPGPPAGHIHGHTAPGIALSDRRREIGEEGGRAPTQDVARELVTTAVDQRYARQEIKIGKIGAGRIEGRIDDVEIEGLRKSTVPLQIGAARSLGELKLVGNLVAGRGQRVRVDLERVGVPVQLPFAPDGQARGRAAVRSVRRHDSVELQMPALIIEQNMRIGYGQAAQDR